MPGRSSAAGVDVRSTSGSQMSLTQTSSFWQPRSHVRCWRTPQVKRGTGSNTPTSGSNAHVGSAKFGTHWPKFDASQISSLPQPDSVLVARCTRRDSSTRTARDDARADVTDLARRHLSQHTSPQAGSVAAVELRTRLRCRPHRRSQQVGISSVPHAISAGHAPPPVESRPDMSFRPRSVATRSVAAGALRCGRGRDARGRRLVSSATVAAAAPVSRRITLRPQTAMTASVVEHYEVANQSRLPHRTPSRPS